jgi:hypothetical protein
MTDTDQLADRQQRALLALSAALHVEHDAAQAHAAAVADADDAIRAARLTGLTWTPIAAVLGVSEVQAYRRARRTGRPMP